MESKADEIRSEILELTRAYYRERYATDDFIPGKHSVRYAGKVFDAKELTNLVESSLDFPLTKWKFLDEFATKISNFLGIENVILTNSGSSANLLAFSALTSEKLADRRLKPGDEVICVAAGFPSSVTPIIQYGLIPVFVDVSLPTYNIDTQAMEQALSDKTRCIFLAHTLGNPFDIDTVLSLARERNLWVIEDNCDAFGSTYNGKFTGTFGDLATFSFYPAHHITTGEGGAVVTRSRLLSRLVHSFRDWGRDCHCAGAKNNSCGRRFSQKFGDLPYGYDHKYVYSEIGYNLKMTDMQAAAGSAQMDKLQSFCESRRQHFREYTKFFSKYSDFFILPEATAGADPSWFSYVLTVRKDAPFGRDGIVKYLDEHLVETRNLFGGNLIRQPAFQRSKHRVAGSLKYTDTIMNNTFFIGTFPGLTSRKIEYVQSVFESFMGKHEFSYVGGNGTKVDEMS